MMYVELVWNSKQIDENVDELNKNRTRKRLKVDRMFQRLLLMPEELQIGKVSIWDGFFALCLCYLKEYQQHLMVSEKLRGNTR
jgi:hypothetical protein